VRIGANYPFARFRARICRGHSAHRHARVRRRFLFIFIIYVAHREREREREREKRKVREREREFCFCLFVQKLVLENPRKIQKFLSRVVGKPTPVRCSDSFKRGIASTAFHSMISLHPSGEDECVTRKRAKKKKKEEDFLRARERERERSFVRIIIYLC
jgi:hypothetical protein